MYLAHFNDKIINRYKSEDKENIVFIDFSSNVTSFFNESAMLNIIESYKAFKKYSSLKYIIESIFAYLEKCDSRVILQIEDGKSQYHVNIDKQYKYKRGRYLVLSDEQIEKFHQVFSSIKEMFLEFFNTIPYIDVIYFKYLESDIVPFLYNKYNKSHDYNGFICSADKDILQCLYDKRINFQMRQLPSIKDEEKRIITRSNLLNIFSKSYRYDFGEDVNPHIVPFLLSICGDVSDGISGVKGIGYETMLKEFKMLYEKEKDLLLLLINYSSINELRSIYSNLIPKFSIKKSKLIEDNIDIIIKNHQLSDFKIMETYIPTHFKDNVKNVILNNHKNKMKYSISEALVFFKELISDDPEWLLKVKAVLERLYMCYQLSFNDKSER